MTTKNNTFGSLFKKYRLKSEFETLSQFGDALAEEGFVYEDSIFSHWQKGDRLPHQRELLLSILNVFIKRGAMTDVKEANLLLMSLGQRDLSQNELNSLPGKLIIKTPFMAPNQPLRFVGREKFLKEICWWVLNKNAVLVYGEAGVGKTYLANKIAHTLKDKFNDGILWYQPDPRGMSDILTDIARMFGENTSRIKDNKTKCSIVKNLLSQKNILLILDNIKSFEEIKFLLPDKKMKHSLLMTTKYLYSPPSEIKCIKLRHFTEKELLELAKKILGLPFTLTNIKKLQQLGKLIGYSPLATTILMRRIEGAPRLLERYLYHFEKEIGNVYKTSYDYDNKTLSTSLNLSFSALPKEIKKTFSSLAVFPGADFSEQAVAYVNDISSREVRSRLNYLKKFSLIEYFQDGRWFLNPLIKIFVKDKLKNKDLYRRLALYFAKFLSQLGRGNYDRYDNIERDINNILESFNKCYQRGYYEQIIELWEYLGVFWWEIGCWREVEKYGLIISRVARQLNDKRALAKCFIRELGWLYYWRGEINKAEKYVMKGIKLAKELLDKPLLTLANIRLGKIYQSKQKCNQAIGCFKQALAYYIQKPDREKQGDTLTYIGETYWLMGQNKKAKHYLKRALNIVNEINDVLQKTTVLSRLGCIALQERDFTQAISYFNNSLLIRKRSVRRDGDDFWNNLALSLTYEKLGNQKQARGKAGLAKKKMITGGYTKEILKVDVFPILFKKEINQSRFFSL